MSENEFNQVFAKNLNRLLSDHQMSQLDLANKLGVSPASVSHWCNGIKSPRMPKIDKICALFKINRSDLMEDHSDEEPSYYTNPETAKLAQEVFDDPNLRILMDASKDLTPEDLKLAIDMVKRLKGDND